MPSPIRVRVYRGDELVLEQQVTDNLVKLGRHSSAHVRLDDRSVAAIHAVLTLDGEAISVTDVSGPRGTLVNGKPVGKRLLMEGDEIGIGCLRVLVDRPSLQAKLEPPQIAAPVASRQELVAEPEPEPMAQVDSLAFSSPLDEVVQFPDRPFGSFVPVEPEPPVRNEPVDAPALQLACYWGDTLLQVSQHPQPETVWMGPTHRCALQAGGAERALIDPLDGGFALHVDTGVQAHRRRGEEIEELGPGVHPLEVADFAWINLGGLRVEASFANQPPRVKVPIGSTIDYRLVNIVLALGFVAAGFAVAAGTRQDSDIVADDLAGGRQVQRIISLVQPAPPTRRQDAPLLQLDNPEPGKPAPKHEGKEGMAGDPTLPRSKPKIGALGTVHLDTSEIVSHSGLLAGMHGGHASSVLGSGGIGEGVRAALGNLSGTGYGANGGFGGLGFKDTGPGGGGDAHTYGIGDIRTHGRGGKDKDFGQNGGLPGKEHKGPEIYTPPPDITGIDPDLVRKVVHSHIMQVRYCYEQRLSSSPGLEGRVRVRFMIGPKGDVPDASYAEGTTILDPELRTCLLSRVRSWNFPIPKGGGSAVVTYPFLFHPSGE